MSVKCSVPRSPADSIDQVAGAEHALEDPLVEEHGVDPLERDLDAGLRQPRPRRVMIRSVVSTKIVVDPVRVPVAEVHDRGHEEHERRDAGRGAGVAVERRPRDDARRRSRRAGSTVAGAMYTQWGRRSRTSSSPSLRMLPRERHGRSVARPSAAAGCAQPQPSSCEPVVVDAEVVADLVDDGDAHLARRPRPRCGSAARIGPPVDRDAVGHRHEPVGVVALGERDALVEARAGPGRAAVLDHDHHVVHQPGELVGQRVEGRRPPAPRTAPRRRPAPAVSILRHRDGRPERCSLAGLDPAQRSAVTADGRTRCASSPAPGRARPGCSPAASPTGSATGTLDARHVLALTFTRKAAGELGHRLAGARPARRPAAGTFHAVAYAQLRSRGPTAGRRAAGAARAQGAGSLGRLLGRTAPHVGAVELASRDRVGQGPAASRPTGYAARGRAADRRTGLPRRRGSAALYAPLRGGEAAAPAWSTSTTCSADCAAAMRGRPRVRRRPALALPPPVRRRVPGRQPAPAPRCSTCWLGDRDDLCVVGDPNQAIYAWNGADADVPRATSPAATRGATVVELVDNYRSTPADPRRRRRGARRRTAAGRSPRTGRPGRCPPVVTYPHRRPTRRSASPGPSATTTTRPGALGPPGGARAHQRARRASSRRRCGRAGIPYRAAGRDAVPRPARGRRRRSPTLAGDRPAACAVALAELAAGRAAGRRRSTDPAARDGAATSTRSCSSARSSSRLEPAGVGRRPPSLAGRDGPARRRARAARDAVELVTFHAAKGLEWPVVHVAGLEDGLVPDQPRPHPEAEAEERRLLYVAVTRAEEELRCTWARAPPVRRSARRPAAVAATWTPLARRDRRAPGRGRPTSTTTRAWRRARAHLDRARRDGRPTPTLLDALHEWRDRLARAGPASRRRSCSPTRRWSRWPSAGPTRSTTSAP